MRHPPSMASLTADLGEMHEEIKKNIRIIRNIQITSTEFTTLIDEGAKIPSTIMNAFGAVLQQLEEQSSGHSDFIVFSSWLGPLVGRMVDEGKIYGTIQGHIEAAVVRHIMLRHLPINL
jgi:hypothetical protein